MALPHVSTGDPHVAAHNAERDAINSLNKGTIGLGNVDNTSDVNKPVSTAQAAAIDYRIMGKGILEGVNLNTLTIPGAYVRPSPTGNTLALNYPVDGIAGYIEVITVGTAYIKQTFTYLTLGIDSSSSPVFSKYERIMYGAGTWMPWVVVFTSNDSLGQKYGKGFPEGVVKADPGSIYIDTEVTNGAQQWIKRTGTNNYGWAVSVGDTGTRDVTADIISPAAVTIGQFLIRRVQAGVQLNVLVGVSPNSTDAMYVAPMGFRPSAEVQAIFRRRPEPTRYLNVRIDPYGGLREPTGYTGEIVGSIFYQTDDPWPTMLHGDPV